MDLAELNRLNEDKQAPGPLVAVQAFMNSCDYEFGEELLADPAATEKWLLTTGLAARGIVIDDDQQRALRDFRETLRAIVESHTTSASPKRAFADLAALAERHPVKLATDATGGVGLDLTPVDTADALISQFLGLVLEAQRSGDWRRLKMCSAGAGTDPPAGEITEPGECRWVFYDASKNRGGHWCRMDMCGNRAKNRTYRERGASRGSQRSKG